MAANEGASQVSLGRLFHRIWATTEKALILMLTNQTLWPGVHKKESPQRYTVHELDCRELEEMLQWGEIKATDTSIVLKIGQNFI